jgi:hypothetical protein
MRDGFREAISGWMLTDDVEGVGEHIEASAAWVKANGGDAAMEPDERAHVRMMILCQAERAIRRGDFEPYIPANLSDAEIREICNFDPVEEP